MKKMAIFTSVFTLLGFLMFTTNCTNDSSSSSGSSGGSSASSATSSGEWTQPATGTFGFTFSEVQGLYKTSNKWVYVRNNILQVPFQTGTASKTCKVYEFPNSLNGETITSVTVGGTTIANQSNANTPIDLSSEKTIAITTSAGTTNYTMKAHEADVLELTEIQVVTSGNGTIQPNFNMGVFEYTLTTTKTDPQVSAQALDKAKKDSKTEQYRIDSGSWTNLNGGYPTVNLPSGNTYKIYFRSKDDASAPVYRVTVTVN